jgi:hypothetical protein
MAVESPPFANQSQSYGAEQTRRAITSLLARGASASVGSIAGGLIGPADLTIAAGGGMSVNVGTGECWVPGSQGATQGGYYGRVASSTNLAVAAANASNPRIDSVSATVTDSAYSGTGNTFAVQVNTGSPTAGATLANLSGAPGLPANSLLIGYVLVPAAASSIVTADISMTAQVIGSSGSLDKASSAYQQTAQVLGTGWTLVTLTALNGDGLGHMVNNGSYYVYKVPANGVYLMSGFISAALQNNPQSLGIGFCVSTSNVGGNTPNLQFVQNVTRGGTGGDELSVPLTAMSPLTAGGYVNMCAYNSGSNAVTLNANINQTQFSILRVS